MKTFVIWAMGLLAAVQLGSCSSQPPRAAATHGTVTPQMRSGSNELRTYQLVEWIAPDDRNLIVNSVDRSLFQARFRSPCTGLRLVDTIAFIVPTPPQVDKYEGVVLPDGKHCVFASITRLETAKDGNTDKP
jgi:hypothetical protein